MLTVLPERLRHAHSGAGMLTVAARSGTGGTPAAVTDGGGRADMLRARSRPMHTASGGLEFAYTLQMYCTHIASLCVISAIRRLRKITEGWQVDLIGLRAEPTVLQRPAKTLMSRSAISTVSSLTVAGQRVGISPSGHARDSNGASNPAADTGQHLRSYAAASVVVTGDSLS
jgi:hypothetical protein